MSSRKPKPGDITEDELIAAIAELRVMQKLTGTGYVAIDLNGQPIPEDVMEDFCRSLRAGLGTVPEIALNLADQQPDNSHNDQHADKAETTGKAAKS